MSYPYRGPPPGRGGHPPSMGYGGPHGSPHSSSPYYRHSSPVSAYPDSPMHHMSPGHGGYMPPPEYDNRHAPHGMHSGHGPSPGNPGMHSSVYGRGFRAAPPRSSPGSRQGSLRTTSASGSDTEALSGFESGSDAPSAAAAKPRSQFANDCEIVVLHKAQLKYAENVERILRDTGLKVDLMFPKGDVKIQEFLKPIAKLGTIFAVVIEAEGEREGTINFFQFRQFKGVQKPTYHKNVPLSKAPGVIKDKYNELKRKEIGLVPETCKGILSKLAGDNTLSDSEWANLMTFLQQRRKRENGFLNRTSNAISDYNTNDISSLADTPEGKELQKRILVLLNENSDSTPADKQTT